MESLVQLQSLLPIAKTPKSQAFFSANSLSKPPLLSYCNATSASHHFPKCFLSQLPCGVVRSRAKGKQNLGLIHASESKAAASQTTNNAAERWLLEPVGDGDSRHIGFKVEMPGVYEIASSEVIVGRVPEKAGLVIPVATVSGAHAYIQKKQGSLVVTDLDSTNGTFIDDKRLRPGEAATVSPGSCITFGDSNLAIFRVSKIEVIKAADTIEETEGGLGTDNKPDNTEAN